MRFVVERVDWASEAREELRLVRQVVFVEEQGVPAELEWNEGDAECRHVLARAPDRTAVGTGRLHPSGRLGRLAVLPAFRGLGVGGLLLDELLAMAAETGLRRVVLHAQARATRFYERRGFVASGEVFMEAGIAHLTMSREL